MRYMVWGFALSRLGLRKYDELPATTVTLIGIRCLMAGSIDFILRPTYHEVFSGNSSVGRASASQAEGREFESRFPLGDKLVLNLMQDW